MSAPILSKASFLLSNRYFASATVRVSSTLLKKYTQPCCTYSSSTNQQPPATLNIEETSKDWIHVERILPRKTIPEPPTHESYPTPSGWVPQYAKPGDYPYFVCRSKFHNFPVYLDQKGHDLQRKLTTVRKIEGNIWEFEKDLRAFLVNYYPQNTFIFTQVNEICRLIRLKGIHLDAITKFLIEKGF
ncbi:large ribosomal subunit protein mL49-like [Tubulanus polymorphus]|uniref:large ribosomal subunit protein mL49-like n=1 Tax=Tubulanus polymorphus TaxID=672921 RepID=UPI003DA3CA6D